MNCLKCGRETPSEKVFCDDCLLEMKKYPVRPGTVVHLPNRKESSVAKKMPRKRSMPLEEQVKLLKRWVLILAVAFAVAFTGLVILFEPAITHLREDHFAIGQNYNAVTTATVPSTPK